MANRSSERLGPIRAIIALCLRDPLLPPALADLGFGRNLLLEPRVTVTRSGRPVVPDIVCMSEEARHAIVWESKSGTDPERSQARRLEDLSRVDFTDGLLLPATDGWDISYLCYRQGAQTIIAYLKRWAVGHNVVVIGGRLLKKVRGDFAMSEVDRLFAEGIRCDVRSVDPAYYPFDGNSPHAEIVPHLSPAVLMIAQRLTARGNGLTFPTEEAAGLAFGPNWALLPKGLAVQARAEICARICEILVDAIRGPLHDFLRKIKGGRSRVRWEWEFIAGSLSPRSGFAGLRTALEQLTRRYLENPLYGPQLRSDALD